jgi:hypothetical protein
MGFNSRCIYFPNIIKAVAKFPCRGAAFEPSPAFQSRESRYVVGSVAERRLIPMIGINRRSATENGYALVDPALKSRAKLTWLLRDREDGCCIYFSKTINAGLSSTVAAATKNKSAH